MKIHIICHTRWEIPFEFLPLGIILNLLPTVSVSYTVDELDDELDEDEDE